VREKTRCWQVVIWWGGCSFDCVGHYRVCIEPQGGEGLRKCGWPELMLRAPRCCPFPARCRGKVYVAVKDHVMCISCGSGQLL
jgi:hypothetical protein